MVHRGRQSEGRRFILGNIRFQKCFPSIIVSSIKGKSLQRNLSNEEKDLYFNIKDRRGDKFTNYLYEIV
jgi:hypothetical protein